MKRILVLLTVAAMMALGVAGQAWADPKINDHNCTGRISSEFSPQGTNKGQWGAYIQPLALDQQADEESRDTADEGNCGSNSVP